MSDPKKILPDRKFNFLANVNIAMIFFIFSQINFFLNIEFQIYLKFYGVSLRK